MVSSILFCFCVLCSLSGGLSFGYDEVTNRLIRYLEINQVKTDSAGQIYGEWKSRIHMTGRTPFGKKGESYDDSNCFVPAWIHCILSDLYLRDNRFEVIPSILDKSLLAVLSYEDDGAFAFYPLKSNISRWKYLDPFNLYQGNLHGPLNLNAVLPAFNRSLNTWKDSDDTALGFLALKSYREVCQYMDRRCILQIPPPDLSLFSRYRDFKGKPVNPFNLRNGHGKATGAYCTYFPPPKYEKSQSFMPIAGLEYMPWGINDIDCVVNANILGSLASYGVVRGDGISASAAWILEMLKGTGCATCGIYYPTNYSLHYSIAKAWNRGAIALDSCIPLVKEQIISKRNSRGYWNDALPGNDLQATLYAVSTLLLIADPDGADLRTIISEGLDYLLKHLLYDQDFAFLPGGVFFSLGFFCRKSIVWKSDAFSTAVLADALSMAKHKQIPRFRADRLPGY